MSSIPASDLGIFHYGPFTDQQDTVAYGSQFLSVGDVLNCSEVNRNWNAAIKYNSGVWLHNFDKEKFPRVEKVVARAQDVFQFMYTRTYSDRKMKPLGKFIGDVPTLTEKAFKWFETAKDPFEPEKFVRDTFVILVEPTYIQVDFDQDFYDRIKRGIKGIQITSGNIMIPHTALNLITLAEALWSKGKIKISVELVINSADGQLEQDDIDQIREPILKIGHVFFMRVEVPPQLRDRDLASCRDRIKMSNLVLMPLRPRLYYDLIAGIANGGCSDDKDVTLTSDVTMSDQNGVIATFAIDSYLQKQSAIQVTLEYPELPPADDESEEDLDPYGLPVGTPAEVLENKTLPSTGKRTYEFAFPEEVNPITVEISEFQAHNEIEFSIVPNARQSWNADWKSVVMVANDVDLAEAQRIARENPKINFFFYVSGNSVIYGDPLAENRYFPHRTAVFFEGEPSWDASLFSDGYVKTTVSKSIFDMPSQ